MKHCFEHTLFTGKFVVFGTGVMGGGGSNANADFIGWPGARP